MNSAEFATAIGHLKNSMRVGWSGSNNIQDEYVRESRERERECEYIEKEVGYVDILYL